MPRLRVASRSMVAASVIAAAVLISALAPVVAQTYPSRAITLVVGLAPGSGQDTTARTISKRASELLGVQIVIENKPGAGTMTASLSVAKAGPDGYTLLQNGPALSVNPSLYKQVPYDAAKDFAPVAFLVNLPMILVVNPSLGVTTLREFLARYKSSDQLTYAHPGAGTMPHLAAELFRVRSGMKLRAVPYRGGAPALTDVIAGHVHMTVVAPLQKPYIDSGQVRALAAGGEARLETLPHVPTFAEAGLPLPEINAGGWLGILAPANTPPEIVGKLNGAFNAALRDEGIRRELKGLGFIPRIMTPREFTTFLHEDMAKWPPIIKAAGISAE